MTATSEGRGLAGKVRRSLARPSLLVPILGLGCTLLLLLVQTTSLRATVRSQSDALAAQESRLEQLRSELQATRSDIETLREDALGLARQTEKLSGRTKKLVDARLDVGALVKSARPSVVTVHCLNSLGSGFALAVRTRNGLVGGIITNHHVVTDCTFEDTRKQVFVTQDEDRMDGEVWTWDEQEDLALIVLREDLPALSPARSFETGDPVVAIGSPFGLEGTVTTGIISNVYSDAVLTDAAMNHGNSGGPLLDRSGRVVGVNTRRVPADLPENANVAIPVDRLCDTIIPDCI